MTNSEKIKEVFGIPMDSKIEIDGWFCNIIDCTGILNCSECLIHKIGIDKLDFWDEEYEQLK
jgi:hypothetical protein